MTYFYFSPLQCVPNVQLNFILFIALNVKCISIYAHYNILDNSLIVLGVYVSVCLKSSLKFGSLFAPILVCSNLIRRNVEIDECIRNHGLQQIVLLVG